MMAPPQPRAGQAAGSPGRTTPVRVCFLIDNLSRAGTETQLLALIRELDRARVAPALVLLDGEGELSRALEPYDCPVLRLGLKRLLGRGTLSAARRLKAFWREHGTEILQVYFLDSAYFGVPLARWCGVRRVVRVRNNLGYWLTRKHRLLNRGVGRLAHVTLTNSEAGKDALVASEALSPDRVTVIENGVDLERYRGFPAPLAHPGTVRVGCVANLRAVKNIDGLMRAARRVCDCCANVVFEVAGDGDERPNLERLRADLNLGERFVLRGSVADVPGFLKAVDVAVLPSHSEGMSNAVLEYMAAGRGIVVTDVGANTRLIHAGEHGLVVPPGDDEALATAIERLVVDAQLTRRLAAAAQKRATAEYSRSAMRERFEALYTRLATEPV
ncbi:Glycosyl transferase [Fimbriiglobus ruber]|uniref:Glycosyl transferase n=1 Tax=Fimbriiglobus ruber TaxID=1908690 RepID=A0A225E6C0_9BACT|nr:Glycosyl transferase [Fimbriiglobus ruber]